MYAYSKITSFHLHGLVNSFHFSKCLWLYLEVLHRLFFFMKLITFLLREFPRLGRSAIAQIIRVA